MTNLSHSAARTRATLALRAIAGVGDAPMAKQIAAHGGAEAALACYDTVARHAALRAADEVLLAAERAGARVLTVGDDDFPSRLDELRDPPAVLYARGVLAAAAAPAVAIVGTRTATNYGLRVTRSIATACARAGATVISGLARGIDGTAHEATLAAGGRTVAVLGTGVDVHFPRPHRALQEQIAREGLLLSELPPGSTGHSGTFPRRNRIIAALADVTVVVEAGLRSGALITANHALDLGRMVACVPNAIDLPNSAGSNALLKRSAEPILSPDDVLALLNLRASPVAPPALDADAASCWDALCSGASDVTAVARRSGLSVRATSAAVAALEVEGLISIDPAGHIRSLLT